MTGVFSMTDPAPDLVYFGDSLTDNGNLYDATQGVLPWFVRQGLAGPTNAASDGVTHAAYTEDLTGQSTANYAVAAGRAVGTYTIEEVVTDFGLGPLITAPPGDPKLDFDINLGGQVDRFSADTAGQDLSGTTAFILIGGNDYGTLDTNSPFLIFEAIAKITAVIDNIDTAVDDLLAQGVGRVVLANLPPVTFFASSAAMSPSELSDAQLLFDSHNAALESLAFLSGGDVDVIDMEAMAEAIVEDPTGFGLIAPYDQTQQGSNVLQSFDPDQVAFWDDIHPTTATHGVLGAHNAHFLEGGNIVSLGNGDNDRQLGAKDDLVLAMGGDDSIGTGTGDDIVFGGTGSDVLRGKADSDLLSGGADADTVKGGSEDDILDGDGGDDILLGNRGNDLLIDGLGSDVLLGGGGSDAFLFTQASLIGGVDGVDADVFDGGGGFDTLYLVLDTATASSLGAALTGASPTAALASLGIAASNIEDVQVLVERDALSDLSGETWYAEADVWGLV